MTKEQDIHLPPYPERSKFTSLWEYTDGQMEDYARAAVELDRKCGYRPTSAQPAASAEPVAWFRPDLIVDGKIQASSFTAHTHYRHGYVALSLAAPVTAQPNAWMTGLFALLGKYNVSRAGLDEITAHARKRIHSAASAEPVSGFVCWDCGAVLRIGYACDECGSDAAATIDEYRAKCAATVGTLQPDCSNCGGFGSVTGDHPDIECTVCNGTGKAAPVAAPPSVPDEWLSEQFGGEFDDMTAGQGYRRGWNDCRAVMLASAPTPPADGQAQQDAARAQQGGQS